MQTLAVGEHRIAVFGGDADDLCFRQADAMVPAFSSQPGGIDVVIPVDAANEENLDRSRRPQAEESCVSEPQGSAAEDGNPLAALPGAPCRPLRQNA